MLAPRSKGFRPDINGLRAWAVVLVVLYHFDVSGLQGGFIGVDVFFVISGFLMTGIILSALQAEHFSLVQFYWARARRIIPALLVLCTVLLLIGWFALLVEDYQTLGRHVRDSLLFVSNQRYLKESGYFDQGVHEKWLLHTWSLSVEWQFYLLLPLVLLAMWRLFRDRRLLVVGLLVLFSASLIWCVTVTASHPDKAFFSLPTRAWEMLAGGLVFLLAGAIYLSDMLRKRLSWLGLLLIVGAATCYSPASSWPGWHALLPVSGAALVLLAQRSDSRWTANHLAQWLGDRSYSIYLWHWPVVVALAYWQLQSSIGGIVAGIALSILLGHVSYHMVEDASRRWLARMSWGLPMAGVLALVVVVMGAAQWVRKSGFPERLPAAVQIIEEAAKAYNPRRDECLDVDAECIYGGDKIQAIVLGDSHADAVMPAIEANLKEPGQGVLFKGESACLVLPGAHGLGDGEDCPRLNRWVVEQLPQTLPGVPVILVNRLAAYVFGGIPGEPGASAGQPRVYFKERYRQPTAAFQAVFRDAYLNSVCQIAQQHPVYLLRPIPEMAVNVPNTIGRSLLRGAARDISVPLAEYQERQAYIWALQDEAARRCGAQILNPLPFLCDEFSCLGSKDGLPFYIDGNHLNVVGARRLTPLFAPLFRSAK